MALFGRAKEPLLRRFLRLPGGVPSHDTFSRLFRLLDPVAFEACFGRFVAAFAARIDEVVAVDGKTARRSFDRRAGCAPLHLVSAWACEQRLVLGQRRVDGHSNEIEARAGAAGPAGAGGPDRHRRRHALPEGDRRRRSSTAEGDYVLALKANQPTLLDDVRLLLDDPAAPPDDVAETADGDHGRIEIRRAEIVHDVGLARRDARLAGLAAVGKVTASREIDGKATTTTRYYLLSRRSPPPRFAEIVRAHWQIENGLHWVLDVVMDEDHLAPARITPPKTSPACAASPSTCCAPSPDQGSTRGKIKRAGWDDAFLLNILGGLMRLPCAGLPERAVRATKENMRV